MRARHLVPRPIRRAASHALAERRASEVERALERLAADPRPIVVGPWLGEVGFELLYWMPFVRWFAAEYAVKPDRLVVVTRGGAAPWYRPLAARAVDALSLMSAADFRRKNHERSGRFGEQKQVAVSALDDEILDHVRRGTARAFVMLHPSTMNRLFAPYWWGHEPVEWVRRYTRHVRLEAPARPAGLPERYAAVKFYVNDCFTSSPANSAFVERTVRRLAEQGPVVALTSGGGLDEHAVCDVGNVAVHRIDDRMAPDTNLATQSAVIAGARQFVGSYGGFAYLAPTYGVPTLTYYSDADRYARCHLDLARAVLTEAGRPLLQVEAVDA